MRPHPLCGVFLLLSLLFSHGRPLAAEPYALLYSGFPAIEHSKAFGRFLKRPPTDRSKLLYLIDRFAESKVQILYDGHYFDTAFASQFARWFLARHYRDESPRRWIMRWCNTSILSGELIRVRLPDGEFRLSREVLLDELKALESVLERRPDSPSSQPA